MVSERLMPKPIGSEGLYRPPIPAPMCCTAGWHKVISISAASLLPSYRITKHKQVNCFKENLSGVKASCSLAESTLFTECTSQSKLGNCMLLMINPVNCWRERLCRHLSSEWKVYLVMLSVIRVRAGHRLQCHRSQYTSKQGVLADK